MVLREALDRDWVVLATRRSTWMKMHGGADGLLRAGMLDEVCGRSLIL